MLSRRKLILREQDSEVKDDDSELKLDDEEIDQLFEVGTKPEAKNHNILKFYSGVAEDDNDKKKKKSKIQAHYNNDEDKIDQATSSAEKSPTNSDTDEDLICLDSDVDSLILDDDDSLIIEEPVIQTKNAYSIRTRSSGRIQTTTNQIKRKSPQNDDRAKKSRPTMALLQSPKPTSSTAYESSDEILISSNSNSPVKPNNADSSFDTSFDPSTLPINFKFVKTTRIKFKFKGSYHCVTFKSTDKFKDKLDEIGETLSIDTSSMILIFDNKTISFEESPESLNIGICDIIDVFEKKKDENLVEDKEDPNMFKIKFRDCESRKRVQDVMLSMNRYDTFEQIFRKYAQLKNMPVDQIIFEFDGERMSQNERPDDLDMENESMVDVKIKNA